MSVQSQIQRLQNAKTALKTAIEGKGVTVPNSTKLDGYADLVDNIESGGGSETVVLDLNSLIYAGETFEINLDNYGDSTVILYQNI